MFKFLCCAFFLCTILNASSSYASENKVVVPVFDDRGYVPKAGYLPTKAAAIAVAEIILAEIYGIEAVRKQKPFSAELVHNVWIIEGHFQGSKLDKGGVARIRLSKLDGSVLYLMHDK